MTEARDAGRVGAAPLVLGLDPGSRVAGFALVSVRSGEPRDVRMGAWKLPAAASRAERLARLAVLLEDLLDRHEPGAAAVEGLFQHRNVRSALALAESRGVLLATLARRGIAVVEYSPATVKQTICGRGNASKADVRRALLLTLPALREQLEASKEADATDALALALCHMVHARFEARVRGASR